MSLFSRCNFAHVRRLKNRVADLLTNLGVNLPPHSHFALTLPTAAIHHELHVMGMAKGHLTLDIQSGNICAKALLNWCRYW